MRAFCNWQKCIPCQDHVLHAEPDSWLWRLRPQLNCIDIANIIVDLCPEDQGHVALRSGSKFCNVWRDFETHWGYLFFPMSSLFCFYLSIKTLCMPTYYVFMEKLTLVLLSPDILYICKQCRSRSVGFWRSQLIWICTVCHQVCEFIAKALIKQSDWLKIRSGCGILIYSAGQGLRRIDTHSRETTLVKTVLPAFWKGVYSKRKKFVRFRSKSFSFFVDPFSERDEGIGMQTGSHKSYLSRKKCQIISPRKQMKQGASND